MENRLAIMPSRHGGFVVLGSTDYGERGSTLFAGSLTDALEFIRARMAEVVFPPKGE